METPKVLSIQSHVVYGYVGNRSATFPLQVLGLEVDNINSVQFSNHTGYKVVKGQILNEKDLGDLIDGLTSNNLDHYSYLLTGYVGNPNFLSRIGALVKHLKTVNPNLIYVCDPVMGDDGKMYVPESLLPIYRDKIIPLADIITPNQYELELLVGRKISNESDIWTAVKELHGKGVSTVIISSSDLGDKNELVAVASSIKEGVTQRVRGKLARLENRFTGTGDLFAALFLGWMQISNGDLYLSLEKTLNTLQAVLHRTLTEAKKQSGDRPLTVLDLELRLVQSKKDIENPPSLVSCERLPA